MRQMVERRSLEKGYVWIVLAALLSSSVATISQKPLDAISILGGPFEDQYRPSSIVSKAIRIANSARPKDILGSSLLVLTQQLPNHAQISEDSETTDFANKRWPKGKPDYVDLKPVSETAALSSEAVDDMDSDDNSFRDMNREHLADATETSASQSDKQEPHHDRNNVHWPYFWSTDGFHILSDSQTTPNIVPYTELCKDWLQGPKAQALGLFFLFFLIIFMIEGARFLLRHSRKLSLVFPRGKLALSGQEKQLRAFFEDIEAGG